MEVEMSNDYEKLAYELMNKNGFDSLAANADALKKLADSPDGRKVKNIIGDQGKMTAALNKGDTAAIQDIVKSVLSTEEGVRLAEQIKICLKRINKHAGLTYTLRRQSGQIV
jgi:hypothetical protein